MSAKAQFVKGQKVRIVGDKAHYHGRPIGEIVTVDSYYSEVDGDDREFCYYEITTDAGYYYAVHPDDIQALCPRLDV